MYQLQNIRELFKGNIVTIERPNIHAENISSLVSGSDVVDLWGNSIKFQLVNYDYRSTKNRVAFQQIHLLGKPDQRGMNMDIPRYVDGNDSVPIKNGDVILVDQCDSQKDEDKYHLFDYKSVVAVYNPEWNIPRPVGEWIMFELDAGEIARKQIFAGSELHIPESVATKGQAITKGYHVTSQTHKVVAVGPGRVVQAIREKHPTFVTPEVQVGKMATFNPAVRVDLQFRGKLYTFIRYTHIDYWHDDAE